ncbi:hypothetical protein N7466_006495 [Penicillium verhagenii]|uniref:uncharacterized protein n=1 Tax=Penicillium verhagenii TaxID=1562060 RepID=UPI0025451B10|nr:uncharacterized protein N7466_006495 [Penicillium verhagenii]KAJ5931002.1 hypothetical protein N7466_006495 [Penicillium verhagenii]
MPPQIKHDLNRSGHESSDCPAACEKCFPANPNVRVLKEDYGEQCKFCSRPFTKFSWNVDRQSKRKSTIVCLTCSRLKNCCQFCLLDLSLSMPLQIRDAALKMVAPGPESSINREYYAQNHEKEIEQGVGAVEEHDKIYEKADELLRHLANSKYFNRNPRNNEGPSEGAEEGQASSSTDQPRTNSRYGNAPGPIRTGESRTGNRLPGRGGAAGRGRGGGRGGRSFASTGPEAAQNIDQSNDRNVRSLFVTGVQQDLSEHYLTLHFKKFGNIQPVQCSHKSACAFVTYTTRDDAVKAYMACKGGAVIENPQDPSKKWVLGVAMAKPRLLDNMTPEEKHRNIRTGRQAAGTAQRGQSDKKAITATGDTKKEAPVQDFAVAPPPGSGSVQYASMNGD